MDATMPAEGYPGYEGHASEKERRRAFRQMKMAMAASGRHGKRRHGPPPFGRGFGPGGFQDGPFFGRGPKVGRGDVRAAILVLLAEEPMHGYQVIQELTERSGGVWRPSPGSIYPTLQLLEDEGRVRSDERDGRRVFELTDSGQAEVAKRGANAPAPWDLAGKTDEPLMELREIGFGVAAAVMQVAQAGSTSQITKAKEILSQTRKSLYRLLAEDEPADDESPNA
jgi:DNA-binding PadR family transcriptional regulator